MSASEFDITSGRAVYRRLLTYVRPYWKAFILVILGMVTVAGSEVGFAALIQPLLDGTFVKQDPFWIEVIPLALLGIFLARGVGKFAVIYCMAWVGRHVVKDLRSEMFEHMLVLPARYYDRQASGQLISKLIYDVEQVSDAASNALSILVQDTLTLIGLLGWMFYLNWKLTLLFLVIGPVVAVLINYVNKRIRRYAQRLQGSVGDVTHISQEAIEGERVVKVFGGQGHERAAFARANENNRHQFMKITSVNAASVPIVQFITASFLALVVYIVTRPGMLEEISVGTFMSFVSAMLMLFPPIRRLTTVNVTLQRGITAAQSVFGFLAQQPERDTGSRRLQRARGEIRYQDVHFCYDKDKGEVLKGISFEARAGEMVAFVGRSGSGKSTLVNLLPRFYELDAGHILLDGIDIRELRLADLRRQIALVSQNVTLFNDTIAHNIAYGRLSEASETDIIAAARAAHAMEFIERLPQGLDTPVGEHGVLLSGGQRQRLAIARAILKDAPVLILDEATSALDTESERHIQQALEILMENRTTFVIAHRLSTIEKADKIIVLEQGRIVETGTHHELLQRGGHYAALSRMQFGHE